jgi:hypothetical protein
VVKKALSILWRYIAAIIIAVIVDGLSSLILKLIRVTVQGPTLESRIIGTVVFFVAFSAAVFVLFRKYSQNEPLAGGAFLPLCAVAISAVHILVAAFSSWSVLWFVTTGASAFAKVLFAGGGFLSSLTEIPRTYYLLAVGLEGICFIVFSWIGLLVAQTKIKRK